MADIVYLLLPFSVIGWLFFSMLLAGLAMNGKQCAIALDKFVGTCIIAGHMADETISAWAHRKRKFRIERLINRLFNDPNHCAKSYISEIRSDHN